MPFGTPASETQKIVDHLVSSAQQVVDASNEPELLRGLFAEVGGVSGGMGGSPRGDSGAGGSHVRGVAPRARRRRRPPAFPSSIRVVAGRDSVFALE